VRLPVLSADEAEAKTGLPITFQFVDLLWCFVIKTTYTLWLNKIPTKEVAYTWLNYCEREKTIPCSELHATKRVFSACTKVQ